MGTVGKDIRHGVRVLFKSPGFTTIAVVTLGLGIGANTAIFSLVDALLLQSLPIREPDRVVQVFGAENDRLISTHAYPSYIDQRDRCDAFSGLAMRSPAPAHVGTGDRAVRVQAALVSGNYFSVLGVVPAAGRLITPADDVMRGGHPVAVLGFDLWHRMYEADPTVIGTEITVNGFPFTVIGVTAEGFGGITMRPTEIWAPVAMFDALKPQRAHDSPHPLDSRDTFWHYIVGRLASGRTIEQAEAQVNRVYAGLAAVYPDIQCSKARLIPVNKAKMGITGRAVASDSARLLSIAVGLILLIACANVANLLTSRAQSRQREIAIRTAVGAGRGRVIRQLLTESLLLAMLGGATGLLIATWVGDLLLGLVPESALLSRQSVDLTLHGRVLCFTLIVSVLTAVVFGLIPALQTSCVDLVPALKASAGMTSPRRRRHSLRDFLVAGQVAVSLILLISAGLLVRTLSNLRKTEPGLDPDGVLLASVDMARQGYDEERGRIFYDRLIERVEAIPDVTSAALARLVPMHVEYQRRMIVEAHDSGAGRPPMIHFNTVSPTYFTTMRIPLLRGRVFGPQDTEFAPGVVVVNRALAERFWNGNALGKHLSSQTESFEVVGVVADGKYHGLRESLLPFAYFSLAQSYRPTATLVARTVGDPMAVLPAVRAATRELDPMLPLFGVETLEDHLGAATSNERMAATLFGAFAVLAVALVVAGSYGVMSHGVSRRVQEIGLRMALGAQRGDVLRLVLVQGSQVIIVGIVVGLVATFGFTHFLRSRLFEVGAADPVTYIAVSFLLAAVTLLACYIPARRATKVDPMVALRNE
ncbi:MAG: ABC transporter permease [Phycisphaerales bacterium]|nr:MAG: ABC transporter permease [Phycisphaerales bacterium]